MNDFANITTVLYFYLTSFACFDDMFSKKQLSLALALTASTTASYAQQSEIEEVIVTATKRAASTQDIPLAVSAVS